MKKYVVGFLSLSALLEPVAPSLATTPTELTKNDRVEDAEYSGSAHFQKKVQVGEKTYIWKSDLLEGTLMISTSAKLTPTSDKISILQNSQFGVVFEVNDNGKFSYLPIFLQSVKNPNLSAPLISFDEICPFLVAKESGVTPSPLVKDKWTVSSVYLSNSVINLMKKDLLKSALAELGDLRPLPPSFARVVPSKEQGMASVKFQYDFQKKGKFVLETSIPIKEIFK